MTNTSRTDRTILIRGGNVLDGTGAAMRPNCSVLIRDGVIAEIGDRAESEAVALPGLPVTEATGKTVMPALVDAHCHITYGDTNSIEEMMFYTSPEFGALRAAWNCRRVLRAGVTTISEPNSIHNIGPALRDAIASGMVEGPRMLTAGPALATSHATGLPNSIKGFAGVVAVDSAVEAIKEVRRQVNDGVDFIKLIGSAEATTMNTSLGGEQPTFSFAELEAVVGEAHRLSRRVAVHARSGQAAADAARAGADWIFHGSFMNDEQLDVVAKSGAVLLPTLTYLANMAEWGLKVGVSHHLVNLCQLELKAAARILSRAREIGVPMLVGSEAGFAVTPYGEWHAREMELFVEYLGYSPMEALSSMTRGNASLLGFDGLGLLEAGKVGDVIVVDGDPLADIRILQDRSKILAVVKEGELLDTGPRRERRPLLHEVIHPMTAERLTVERVRA
jgi:imidazolonepropionase-like amidohydrolase